MIEPCDTAREYPSFRINAPNEPLKGCPEFGTRLRTNLPSLVIIIIHKILDSNGPYNTCTVRSG